ncbi:magnesium transporter CorA family protein [Desemzia sp. RIT804]|uniref:magnesium transporter CorA family protein n=1 Tax=Desemzia sp. RIT 804 TaxID=2810209 RepID=UPI00194FA2F2|nr:magnesium transporter CorA family protein [Desemzia sp. RIT 804]MBM6613373.1 magnesium transporter CorA family protein [Desemzia sp. RIT 804]
MIEYFKRDKNGKITPNPDPENTISCWIHVTKPEEKELNNLVNLYDLPMDYLTGAFDNDEVSRYEKLDERYKDTPSLIVLLYPIKVKNRLNLVEYNNRPLSIILSEDILITATNDTPDFLRSFMETDTSQAESFEASAQFVLLVSMQIASLFISYLKEINQSTEELEVQLKKTSKSQHLFDLMELQKSLVYLSSAINSNHPVINRLKEIEDFTHNIKDEELLRDVMVENHQAEVMTDQTYKLLNQLSSTFSSVISNNLNTIVKFLTSITFILTIPTIIGSIWGMNVPVPFEKSPYGFWILLFGTLILGAVTAYWMKKNEYF